MRIPLLLVAIALLSGLPTAAAGPIVDGCYPLVCIHEDDVEGDCWEYDRTLVTVPLFLARAWVVGLSSERCDGSQHYIGAGFSSYPGVGASATWEEETSGGVTECDTRVSAIQSDIATLGCPAGSPPNPGWGSLLP